MGLIKYNTSNVIAFGRRGTPTIRFSKKGASSISAAAVELMGYQAGDRISFMKDEEDPKADWSLIKDTEEGFELRSSKGTKSLMFNNVAIAEIVLEATGKSANSMAFRIANESFEVEGESDPAWTIIMASGK